MDAIFLSIEVGLLGHLLLEELHVFVRNSEMHVCLAIGRSIERTLNQMFLHWRTRTLGVVME